MSKFDNTDNFLKEFKKFKERFQKSGNPPTDVTPDDYLDICKTADANIVGKTTFDGFLKNPNTWKIVGIAFLIVVWFIFLAIIAYYVPTALSQFPKNNPFVIIGTVFIVSLLIICPTVLLGFAVKFYCNKED